MLQNKFKSRSRSSQYQQTLSSPKEILCELLKIDDEQIFMKELDQMKGLVKIMKSEENQTIAMTEFLKQKLEEVESQISIANSIVNTKNSPSTWASLIDLEKLEETKSCIINEMKLVLSKTNERVSEYEKIPNSQKTDNNFYNSRNINLKLNVIYHDGSDLQPQVVNLEVDPEISFREFLKLLKESLEIYEFSRFKLVLINEKKEEKFITKMAQFKYNYENIVKIVPKNYILSVNS